MLFESFGVVAFFLPMIASIGAESTKVSTAKAPICKCVSQMNSLDELSLLIINQTPIDHCWPRQGKWEELKSAVSGKMIRNIPAAIVCYPGPLLNLSTCAEVLVELTNSTFVADDPIALGYPIENTCPAVDYAAGETPGNCTLGTAPVYTVDALTPEDVIQTVNFARKNNLRLVIKNTGHDITGRYA